MDEPLPRMRRGAALRCAAKRIVDIAAALAALVWFSPLLFVIAVAIKRDSDGPILFRQIREGYRRTTFTILKFRTMVHPKLREGTSRFEQARPDDPRVTGVGAYLRASSFDELPQFLNVLAGSLSLVGPRPHVPELSARFATRIDGYYERLEVRPGITGLAQVNGLRGETETLQRMEERVRFDRHYVRTWSLAGDLAICVRTVKNPLRHDRAY